MTQAVAGASQNAVEALSQPALTKASEGTSKTGIRFSHGTKAKPAALADQAPEGDTGTPRSDSVQRSGKTPQRSADKTEKSVDGDTSFEATIDSIGPASAQVPAAVDAGQNAGWGAEIALAGQMAAIGRVPQENPAAALPSVPSKGVLGSANLLKQESIAALLNAKDRLLSGDASATADSAKGATTDSAQRVTADFAQSAKQQDAAVVTPVVVNSQETHWNFDAKAAPAALVQAGNVPPGLTVAASQQDVLKAAVGPQDAPKDAVPPKDGKAPVATSASNGPQDGASLDTVATLSIPAASKPQDGAPKTPPDKMSSAAVQGAPLAPVADTSPRQSFEDGRQGAANSREQSPSTKVETKVASADTSTSADRLSPDVATAPGGTPNVTEQIQTRIVDALAGNGGDAKSPDAAPVFQPRTAAPPQVLRTIDLTLSPADLGSVRLKLSLKSNTLAIEAEASKASTAQILHNDRAALEQNLRDAGYDVSTLKISDAAASNSTGTNSWQSSGNPFRDGDQPRPGFAGRQDADLQRRDSGTPDQAQQRSKDNSRQSASAPDTQNSRQANALYI